MTLNTAGSPVRRTLTAAISNYNHAKYLPRAIDAIISQSRPPDELILVDDKSTDESVDVIRDYAARVPYLRPIFRERNGGFVAGITDALSAATGDYLYAGSADDFILPGFFEHAMTAAEAHPGAGLVYGDWQVRDQSGNLTEYRLTENRNARYIPPAAAVAEILLGTHALFSPSPATIYRLECMQAVGGYRRELASICDSYQIWCISSRYGAAYVPLPFAMHCYDSSGFHARSVRDFRKFVGIIRRAADLMRTECADIFSPKTIQQWQRRTYESLVRQHADLTTPYQGVLRFDELLAPRLRFPKSLLMTGLRKSLSLGVRCYQHMIQRSLVERLMVGNDAELADIFNRTAPATSNPLMAHEAQKAPEVPAAPTFGE